MNINTESAVTRTSAPRPALRSEATFGTAASTNRVRDLVSEEATFETSSAPEAADSFLEMGALLRRGHFTRPETDRSAEARLSQTFGESIGHYNDQERFGAIDANNDGLLSINEAARLESSSGEVHTGQTDAALNLLSKVGDQVTNTNRDQGVFSLEDIRYADEALRRGESVEAVEAGLLERLQAPGTEQGTGPNSGVTLPGPTNFDEEHYLAENPDVAAAVESGAIESGMAHYEKYGKSEGRDPNAGFDEVYYLDNNPDVADAVESGAISSGFEHYQKYGAEENRLPSESHRELSEGLTLDEFITNHVNYEISFGNGENFAGRDRVIEAYREQYGIDADTLLAAGSVIDSGFITEFGLIPPGASGL